MSKTEALLETAELLDDPSVTNIEYGIGARVLQPKFVKALWAVLGRHQPSFPMPRRGARFCIECSRVDSFDLVTYPCKTITDIEEAVQ